MSLSEITSLQQTLNTALDAYKAELAAQNLPEPTLTTAAAHPIDDIGYLPTPAMYEACRAAIACMGRLKQMIIGPYDYLCSFSYVSPLENQSLRLAAEMGLSDLLEEVDDPEIGMSIVQIAAKADVDEQKLERIMRLLMAIGFYREPKEGYFANNRLSNLIKKGSPGHHINTYMNVLMHRVGEKISDQILHPDDTFRKSHDARNSAWNLAYNTDLPYFGADGWLAKHPSEGKAFGLSMGAVGTSSDAAVAADFPWLALSQNNDAIIDVGGGQGTLACSLARRHPSITNLVVQDLAEMTEAAESYIASQDLSDRVKFEAQDFFKAQRRKGKYAFILQRVLHDWSTEEGAEILRQLRDVLHPQSSILIVESIIEPAITSSFGDALAHSLHEVNKASDSHVHVPPPPFIPFDFGEASRMNHGMNVTLTTLCNSFERTLPQLKEMVGLAGLKIKKIHAIRGWTSITEAVLPDT